MEDSEKPQVLEDSKTRLVHQIKKFLPVILIILVVLAGGYFFLKQKNLLPKINQIKPTVQSPAPKSPSQVVAKVGAENIYQSEVDYEIANFPAVSGNQEKTALDRLVNDSIALQGASSDGLVKLDSSTFNSPGLDYKKRMALVEKIKSDLEKNADTVSGYIVSIWFLNDHVGPLGYQAAKEMALQKITKLHDDVISKKITIQQAGNLISNDQSLAQLDKAYKSNAIFYFKATKDNLPSFSDSFNNALWNLNVGAVSDIFTIQSEDLDNGSKLTDAYFSFGQLVSKTAKGQLVSFDEWFKNKKTLYEVKIF